MNNKNMRCVRKNNGSGCLYFIIQIVSQIVVRLYYPYCLLLGQVGIA